MTIFWSLLQMITVIGVMGYGCYFWMKKVQKNQFNKTGEKGRIQIVDGLNLNHQTSSYLLNVDGQKLFVVVGANGTETILLKDRTFQSVMNEDSIEEVVEQ